MERRALADTIAKYMTNNREAEKNQSANVFQLIPERTPIDSYTDGDLFTNREGVKKEIVVLEKVNMVEFDFQL